MGPDAGIGTQGTKQMSDKAMNEWNQNGSYKLWDRVKILFPSKRTSRDF